VTDTRNHCLTFKVDEKCNDISGAASVAALEDT
jgi:hypothetical protein